MIRDRAAWVIREEKGLCYYPVRSANQNKINSFTVKYIWQNHVACSNYSNGSAGRQQYNSGTTWNKLDPLCIRNICNITVYCYICFLWDVKIQVCSFKIINYWSCRLKLLLLYSGSFMSNYFSASCMMRNTFLWENTWPTIPRSSLTVKYFIAINRNTALAPWLRFVFFQNDLS